MSIVLKAEDCVLVSKNEQKGKDKNYYTVGVSQGQQTVKEFNVSEEIYRTLDKGLFYKPVILRLEYVETRQYGSFLQVYSIEPGEVPRK